MNELAGKRLLIIEDNPINMAVFVAILKKSGAFVFQDIWNINAAENLAKYLPLDGILLDLMLRRHLSGYDVFDEIKINPKLAQIPVIAVSAADPYTEIPRAKEKGFTGFIGKPIRPPLFPDQIASCLNGEGVWYAQDGRQEEYR